jgi:hypothetical protein
MVLIPICHSDQVIKGGKTKAGIQRYTCLNVNGPLSSFQLDLMYKGRCPALKEQIVDKLRHDLLYASASLSRLAFPEENPHLAAPVFSPTLGLGTTSWSVLP